MSKNRLEAFSDGVLAIIITIMVLELKVPSGTDWVSIKPLLATLASYALSFAYIGIYWGNHHHLLHTVTRVNGKIMWANLHLLFWLSLVPFTTRWIAETNFSSLAVAVYAVVLVFASIAFTVLAKVLIKNQTSVSELTKVFHKTDLKGKISSVLYFGSIPLAFVDPLVSCIIFVVVAMIWIAPNKDVEKLLSGESGS